MRSAVQPGVRASSHKRPRHGPAITFPRSLSCVCWLHVFASVLVCNSAQGQDLPLTRARASLIDTGGSDLQQPRKQ